MMSGLRRTSAAVRRRHRAVCSESDRGYSVLEAAITLPTMIVLTMIIVQYAIMWHARGVAQAAVQEGLRTCEAYQSTADAGRADAENFLRQTAPRLLPNPQVSCDRGPTTVTVRVRGPVRSLIPFFNFTVDSAASGPVENYVQTP